jgi:hypothetical protein
MNHCGSRVVTLDELRQLRAPEPIGPRHVPVPHHELVSAILDQVGEHGWNVTRQRVAVGGPGDAKLFGTLDLVAKAAPGGAEIGRALGFKHANDGSLGLCLVAGATVFVCDNGMFSGEFVVMNRRHTKGFDVRRDVADGLAQMGGHFVNLDRLVMLMKETPITDRVATQAIYSAIVERDALALRHIRDVHEWYLERPFAEAADPATMTDVLPRSVWGLCNAFTRVTREMPLHQQQRATMAVTRALTSHFGLS